jgi:two-component system, oxyanion-binding sensor
MIELNVGFVPLLDASILIMAHEKGFAEEQGLQLKLMKETSWANIRDRLSVGQFHVAHMLAPLPIAQNLGLSPLKTPLIAPFALGLGGNAITVSQVLYAAMGEYGPHSSDPAKAGAALRAVVMSRKAHNLPNLVFAVVHGFSVHSYELRYWLAASGIDADENVTITIVPPAMMGDALATGAIDGFCVGEPWNSNAVAEGLGEVVTTKASIWKSSPEKVLGLRKNWAEENRENLNALLVALHNAAMWCSSPVNRDEMARILAKPHYIGVDEKTIGKGLIGNIQRDQTQEDFLIFSERAANFPWVSHALWIYSQMVRWKQIQYTSESEKIVSQTYRPDIYRQALGPLGVSLPGGSSKVEGALTETTRVPASGGPLTLGPDGFFDGIAFDPSDIKAYLKELGTDIAVHN